MKKGGRGEAQVHIKEKREMMTSLNTDGLQARAKLFKYISWRSIGPVNTDFLIKTALTIAVFVDKLAANIGAHTAGELDQAPEDVMP